MTKENLIEEIFKANRAYRVGKPIMSDKQFDDLCDQLKEKDSKLYKEIRPLLSEEKGDYKLPIIMGSLEKLKAGEDESIEEWSNAHKANTDKWIVSSKCDGMSLLAIYVDSKLQSVVTRGDGYKGKDQTEKLSQVIPHKLPDSYTGVTLIRGEGIITKPAFEALNLSNSKVYKNPRNAVVGLVGADDMFSACKNYITFVAYQIYKSAHKFSTYKQVLVELKELGFHTPDWMEVSAKQPLSTDILMPIYNKFKDEESYEIDGIVIQNNTIFGECDKYIPDYAVAFKANQLAVETTLEDVEWEVSKDGSLRPIGIVAPVELGGATINRVSVYNYDWLMRNRLGKGSKITLLKSGEIIPKVADILEHTNDFTYIPETCPVCGSSIITVGKQLYCSNPNCKHAITKSVAFFLKNLGVEECSEKSLRNWNIVSLDDLLDFVPEKSSKQQTKLISELNTKLFPITEEKLILSFDYSGVGEKLIKKIIKANSCEDFIGVFFGNEDKPLNIPTGITENTFNRISKAIKNNKLDKFYNRLISDDRWIKFNDERERIKRKNQVESSKELAGKSFCFTGALSIGRNFAAELVEKLGGDVKSSVSGGLTYLVTENANSGSTKAKKARQLGTTVLGEKEFFDMVHYDPNKGRQVESDDIDNL